MSAKGGLPIAKLALTVYRVVVIIASAISNRYSTNH